MEHNFADAKQAIAPYATEKDILELERLQKNFRTRIDDFYREDRKLNLAVIGRMKAGKSTFLNMLLFDGKEILPQAFTPKTATLTKIEYAPQNALEIQYYTAKEWSALEQLAQADREGEDVEVAKELVSSAQQSGVDIGAYTAQETEKIPFASEADMMNRLNQYVGNDGQVTPLVKSVTLYLNRKEIEGVSIVDTPGLNDPVTSRTMQTRKFLELCDTIFFLSPATQFLNKNDVDLLYLQLPQKGIADLTLICSKFDSGLVDANFDTDSLQEALLDSKKKLRHQAINVFSQNKTLVEDDPKAKIIKEACQHPVFLSTIVHQMIGKTYEEYTPAEKKAFDDLNEEHEDFDEALIAEIGDTSAIENKMKKIIAQKDTLLEERANSFIPSAQKELRNYLNNLYKANLHDLSVLAKDEQEGLEKQRQKVLRQIHDIQSKIEEHFGTLSVKLEEAKISIRQDLRRSSREYNTIADKQGVETHVVSYEVSDSHWYNPFSWGKSHTEYSHYETTYTYVDASDALENIRNYANEAGGTIEEKLAEAVNIKGLKKNLLHVIVDNIAEEDNADFDPGYFRLVTERTLNSIEFPLVKLNPEEAMHEIESNFSGEIRDGEQRGALRTQLAKAISELFDSISEQLEQEVKKFKKNLLEVKQTFSDKLLQDINEDFARIETECKDKEASIAKLKKYNEVLETLKRDNTAA